MYYHEKYFTFLYSGYGNTALVRQFACVHHLKIYIGSSKGNCINVRVRKIYKSGFRFDLDPEKHRDVFHEEMTPYWIEEINSYTMQHVPYRS